jgi:hypothetical protein
MSKNGTKRMIRIEADVSQELEAAQARFQVAPSLSKIANAAIRSGLKALEMEVPGPNKNQKPKGK